jgi:hypothetical protein
MRRAILGMTLAGLAAAIGCGKDSAPASPSSPGATLETFTGTARANGPGSCTGDAHTFLASAGTISLTLVETTPPENMTAQICSTNSATDCSLTRRQINVGQTIDIPRNNVATQSLSLLPLTCGTNAPPSPSPISYTATVRYLK